MNKLKELFFIILLTFYALGICIGGIHEVRTDKQAEMYDYLQASVSEYDKESITGIKGAAFDNIKVLAALALGGAFKGGIVILPAVIFFKGYTAGFSITAALRLYGMHGFVMCAASIVSAVVLIPAIAFFASVSLYGLFTMDKHAFFKRYFIMLLAIAVIFCIDSIARGFFSTVFMGFAKGMVKPS